MGVSSDVDEREIATFRTDVSSWNFLTFRSKVNMKEEERGGAQEDVIP